MRRPLFFILLLPYTISFTQIFTGIEFENYSPIWTRISKSDKLPLNIKSYELEQGPGNAPLVIQNGVMYNVYNIFNQYLDGYYIEAVDLNDGKLIWDDSYLGKDFNTLKVGLLPNVTNEILQLPILAENDPSGLLIWPLWVYAKSERNTYNIKTGQKIDSTTNIPLDSMSKVLGNYYSPFQSLNRFRLYANSNSDNNTCVVNKSFLNGTTLEGILQYESLSIAPNGLPLDSIGITFNTYYQISSSSLVDLVEDNSMFIFSFSKSGSDSTDKTQSVYQILTRDLKVLEQGDLSELLPKGNYFNQSISFVDKSNFSIVTHQLIMPDSDIVTNLSIFNRKGGLLESIDLTSLNIDLQNNQEITTTLIYENNLVKTLFCIGVNENGRYKFNFYKSNGKGDFSEIKSLLTLQDEKSNIRISRIHQIGNNILCLFKYKEGKTGLNPTPLWPCWVMIKGSDLEVGTKDNPTDSFLDNIRILSNPVTDKLRVNVDPFKFDCIQVLDIYGRSISRFTEFSSEIDVTYLSKGFYFLNFHNTNGQDITIKFIKN